MPRRGDLRAQILRAAAADANATHAQIAARVGCHVSTVRRHLRGLRPTTEALGRPGQSPDGRRPTTPATLARAQALEQNSDNAHASQPAAAGAADDGETLRWQVSTLLTEAVDGRNSAVVESLASVAASHPDQFRQAVGEHYEWGIETDHQILAVFVGRPSLHELAAQGIQAARNRARRELRQAAARGDPLPPVFPAEPDDPPGEYIPGDGHMLIARFG